VDSRAHIGRQARTQHDSDNVIAIACPTLLDMHTTRAASPDQDHTQKLGALRPARPAALPFLTSLPGPNDFNPMAAAGEAAYNTFDDDPDDDPDMPVALCELAAEPYPVTVPRGWPLPLLPAGPLLPPPGLLLPRLFLPPWRVQLPLGMRVRPGSSWQRMNALGVCELWLHGQCFGPPVCSLRHPRWMGNVDLFQVVCCRDFQRNGCRLGADCPQLHLPAATAVQQLTVLVGAADACWDWTQNEEMPPYGHAYAIQQGDALPWFLATSPVLSPAGVEAVYETLQYMVRGDAAFEAYLAALKIQFRISAPPEVYRRACRQWTVSLAPAARLAPAD